MGLYSRIENEKRGEESRLNQMAEERGREIAAQEMERRAIQEAEQAREADAQAVRDIEVRNLGRKEGASVVAQGLGMGSQTVEGMNQQVQMEQESMNQAAMQIIGEIENAQAQGATEEQLNQMIQSIPPELNGVIKNIQTQRAQEMQQNNQGLQQVEEQIPQETDKPMGRKNSGITDYAKNLLQ